MHANALKYWDFYRGKVKETGSERPGEKASSAEILELSGSSVSPTDRPHYCPQCCDCTNHGQHQKTHHQEKRGPHIVEDNMIHLIALLCRSVYRVCHPQLQSQGDIGSRFVSQRRQQGQCLVHTCLLP